MDRPDLYGLLAGTEPEELGDAASASDTPRAIVLGHANDGPCAHHNSARPMHQVMFIAQSAA